MAVQWSQQSSGRYQNHAWSGIADRTAIADHATDKVINRNLKSIREEENKIEETLDYYSKLKDD